MGKYMLRPVLALERLTFLEPEGKVDPMLCPKCGGRMKVIAFLADFSVVDRSSPGVIDTFPALIYASVRWRDGIIDAKTRLQPAQQKTKYPWRQINS